MSFGGDIQSFSRRTGIKLDKVVRKVVIDMTSEIVKMTPVDTGAARSNWFWGTNRVTPTDPALSKAGSPSLVRSAEFAASVAGGGVYYLTNNLPYIMPLEFGSSKQAPVGMARVTVARFQAIVNAAVGSVR